MPPFKRILKDNIHGVTRPAIKRISNMSKSSSDKKMDLSGLVFEEMRGVIYEHLNSTLKNAFIIVDNARRTLISADDVRQALEFKNRKVVYSNKPTGQTPSKCKGSKPPKTTGCFAIPVVSFNRLAREVLQNFTSDKRLSSEGLHVLHIDTENYAVEVMRHARHQAQHADRKRIQPKDVQIVQNIKEEH